MSTYSIDPRSADSISQAKKDKRPAFQRELGIAEYGQHATAGVSHRSFKSRFGAAFVSGCLALTLCPADAVYLFKYLTSG